MALFDGICAVSGCRFSLDYELELGFYIGRSNELGTPVPVDMAQGQVFGYCLLNDWSARDIQAWEYQPLGPFLAKNFLTSISPWVVTSEALAPFRVLRGTECDILPDGQLDLSPSILRELDWVQASVHGGQRMPRAAMTRRVEEALRHPAVRCLSHPLGRLIGRRPENALDLERVFEVAREHDVALEVNGLAARLDLSGEHVRDALRAGLRIVCSTDAHSVRGLGNMTLAVHTARRGGATAADVVNTMPWHRE